MSAGWIIFLAASGMAAGLLLWLGGRWLARSWEVLDDDQLADKLSGQGHPRHSSAVWTRMLGWFTRGRRRLTYRRDERGRFRKIRR